MSLFGDEAISTADWRRWERWIVWCALLAVTALAWCYLFTMPMTGMSHGEMVSVDGKQGMAMPVGPKRGMMVAELGAWTVGESVMMGLMWIVMMIGMMLPSAAPMVLMVARVSAGQRKKGARATSTTLFASGYVVVWSVFSVLATALQWGLERTDLLGASMSLKGGLVAGGVLIAAGLYQFSPLKDACLSLCRSPLAFVLNHWREGPRGALVMGMHHGVFCLGCCWALMLLLFVFGVMDLLWVALLALYVLVEKVVPGGRAFSRVSGVLAIAGGAYLALS